MMVMTRNRASHFDNKTTNSLCVHGILLSMLPTSGAIESVHIIDYLLMYPKHRIILHDSETQDRLKLCFASDQYVYWALVLRVVKWVLLFRSDSPH
uniref:Uncharacterized protein n=1 Tax=Physcomitrium patens TaxID=3218 RepID=A0A2K1L3N7_PHYPA|nr:hypothetical protein PHYPA_003433 [Physcomitrium patens]